MLSLGDLSPNMKRLSAALISAALTLTLCISCSDADQSGAALLRDAQAAAAGEASFSWLKARVEMMVEHKADCAVMAEHLREDDRRSASSREQWRAARAQEWLIAKSAVDFEFQKELSEVITRGDLVYSFCAFFEDFRSRLSP